MSTDPFAVLGIEAEVEVDERELEQRYLTLSRACHPDHLAQASTEEQVAGLQQSAALNDAYRALRDPWQRLEALLELRAPGALDGGKALDPAFLMSAMELAEEVAGADGAAVTRLAPQLDADIADYRTRIAQALRDEAFADAATLLHESRYFRKARKDLPAS